MALATHSSFIYGFIVTADNQYINFKEGAGPEKTAIVPVGSYSLTKYIQLLAAALNESSSLDWTVTVNRATRIITITSSGPATLLFGTGINYISSVASMAGFNATDYNNLTSFVGSFAVGTLYSPQYKLQDYKDPSMTRKLINPTVNKSTSKQKVSLQYFGVEEFFKFNIKYVTNRNVEGSDAFYRNNPNAVEELKAFLNYIIYKSVIEFMPDESKPDTYYRMYLDMSAQDSDGVGYDLIEYVDRDLPDFFETGMLTFTVINQE